MTKNMTDKATGIDDLIAETRSAYFAHGGPAAGDPDALRRALEVMAARTIGTRFCGNAPPLHPSPGHRGFFYF
jgi:hypothetical protein